MFTGQFITHLYFTFHEVSLYFLFPPISLDFLVCKPSWAGYSLFVSLKLSPGCVWTRVGKWSPTSRLLKAGFSECEQNVVFFCCGWSVFAHPRALSALCVRPVLLQGTEHSSRQTVWAPALEGCPQTGQSISTCSSGK